jgi:hypothetical protein
MANLSEIARARRADFRLLLKSSRNLDAKQEALEREIKRIVSRKNSVPEAADAQRILTLMQGTQQALTEMGNLMETIASHWASI